MNTNRSQPSQSSIARRKRQWDKVNRIVERINSLHKDANSSNMDFETYLQRSNEIRSSKEYRTLTHYGLGFVRGVETVLFNQLRDHLVYILVGPDGRIFHSDNNSWLSESHEYKSSMKGNHVWKAAITKNQVRWFGVETPCGNFDLVEPVP